MKTRKSKQDDGPKYYAVHAGVKPGIYYSWEDCKAQIDKIKGAQYKKFGSLKEAQDFVEKGLVRSSGKFYGVRNGRVPGVYTDWPTAFAQITGWPKPAYRSFPTRKEAEAFVKGEELSVLDSRNVKKDQPDDQPPNKKQKILQADEEDFGEEDLGEENYPPGHGPMPPMEDDTFDTDILLDPASGELRYKTEAEYKTTKMQPNGLKDTAMIHIHTDGSSRGNGQEGATAGVGVYFGPADPRNLSEGLLGGRQTNQRAELTAIQRAIELAPRDCDITIHSDSNYAIKCVTEWFQRWRGNNWKSAAGKPVENRDIIETVIDRIEQRHQAKVKTLFHWVKGHSDDPGNIAADHLAVSGAMQARAEGAG